MANNVQDAVARDERVDELVIALRYDLGGDQMRSMVECDEKKLRELLAAYADAARDREIVDAMESGRVSFYGMPSRIGGGFGAQDTATMTVTDGVTVRGIWHHLERIRLDAARTGEAR